MWKHSRLWNKYPPWVVSTLHCRSLFKSSIVEAEFHFLTRLKTLDLNILKRGFHEVDWVGKDRSNHIQLDNSKVRLLGMGKELMTKMTKSNKGWRECSQKLMSLSQIFSIPIFFSTEISILRISCDSDIQNNQHKNTTKRLSVRLL